MIRANASWSPCAARLASAAPPRAAATRSAAASAATLWMDSDSFIFMPRSELVRELLGDAAHERIGERVDVALHRVPGARLARHVMRSELLVLLNVVAAVRREQALQGRLRKIRVGAAQELRAVVGLAGEIGDRLLRACRIACDRRRRMRLHCSVVTGQQLEQLIRGGLAVTRLGCARRVL